METVPIGSSDFWTNIAVLLLSVLAVAFFSSSEASLISVNKIRIRSLAEQGSTAAQAVQRVLSNHDKFFATILLTENAFIIFASSMGTALAIGLLGPHEESIVVATLSMTVLIVIFGEITPKTLGALTSERLAMLVARPIGVIMALETPIIAFFTLVPRAVIRLLGSRLRTGSPFVTEAELRMLIEIGEIEGTLEASERRMLQRIFEFTDRLVREVMTPRPEIQWLNRDATIGDFLSVFAESYHSCYLICDGDPDDVLGIIYIKEVLPAVTNGGLPPQTPLARFVHPAYFVPETKRVGELFEEMRAAGHQMAVIIDEYGGTAGLVTLKQLVEEIVGRVGDEIVGQQTEYERVNEYTFQVDGAMRIDEVREVLGVNLPEGDYETVAGFVLARLGHVPRSGEAVYVNDLRLTVTEMSGVKIEGVKIERLQPARG